MSPFRKLLQGIKGAFFWMSKERWESLVGALERDRIIIMPSPGIVETPTPTGRAVFGLGGGGPRVRFRWNEEGEAHYFQVVANDEGLASEIDEEEA